MTSTSLIGSWCTFFSVMGSYRSCSERGGDGKMPVPREPLGVLGGGGPAVLPSVPCHPADCSVAWLPDFLRGGREEGGGGVRADDRCGVGAGDGGSHHTVVTEQETGHPWATMSCNMSHEMALP